MRTLFLLAALTLPAGLASAQDTPECRQVRPGYVQCETQIIHGTPPRSFLLLSRQRGEYALPDLRRRDLVREVRRAVRRDPF